MISHEKTELDRPLEGSICSATNFVYTTVSEVDTRPHFRNLIVFQTLVFSRKLTDSGPDSALGIMIASCWL